MNDERAADTLADRETVTCHYCHGRGWVITGPPDPIIGLVEVLVCRGCDGDGVLAGRVA